MVPAAAFLALSHRRGLTSKPRGILNISPDGHLRHESGADGNGLIEQDPPDVARVEKQVENECPQLGSRLAAGAT